MKKRVIFSICICVVMVTLTTVGFSGCSKKSDESNISVPVEQTATNEAEEQSSNTEKPSNSETISTPYIIDTVAKAEITDTYTGYYCYTQDKNDNIYYIDNNCIYKVNAYSGTADKILDAKDVIVDNEEMTLSEFSIVSIAYSDNANKLFMTGKFNSVNSAKNVSSYYLYSITNGSAEVITDTLKGGTKLIKILNNEDYVVGGDFYETACILNGQTYEETDTNVPYLCDVYDNNTELYMTTPSVMYKYNFMERTEEWRKSAQAVGINDEYVALAQDDIIELCNLKGKTLETISSEEVTVIDRDEFNTSVFEKKMLFTSKNDILFYDKTAEAFRIIKKNDTAVSSSADEHQ